MRIGHIDLSARITAAEKQLVVLVEALTAHGVEQHVLVRNPFLAKRLSVCGGVTVGPTVRSPLAACFLMPAVDLVHAYESKGASTAMMLSVVRSVPYILTHRKLREPGRNPLQRLKYNRSETIVCASEDVSQMMLLADSGKIVDTIGDAQNIDDEIDAENGRISAERMAAEYLRVYRRTLDNRCVPGLLL